MVLRTRLIKCFNILFSEQWNNVRRTNKTQMKNSFVCSAVHYIVAGISTSASAPYFRSKFPTAQIIKIINLKLCLEDAPQRMYTIRDDLTSKKKSSTKWPYFCSEKRMPCDKLSCIKSVLCI